MTNNKALLAAAAIAAAFCAVPAFADDDAVYSNSLRLGSESVFYHTKADDITGPYVPPGVNIKAENLETLYAAYVRRLSSAFDLELAVGYPPQAKVDGKGPATVGSVPYNRQNVSRRAGSHPPFSSNINSSPKARICVLISASA